MLPSFSRLSIGVATVIDGEPLSDDAISKQTCIFCFDELGPPENWDRLCVNQHAFHRKCIMSWIQTPNGKSCPEGRCAFLPKYRAQREEFKRDNSNIDEIEDEIAFADAETLINGEDTEKKRFEFFEIINERNYLVGMHDSRLLERAIYNRRDLPSYRIVRRLSQHTINADERRVIPTRRSEENWHPSMVSTLLYFSVKVVPRIVFITISRYSILDDHERGYHLWKKILDQAQFNYKESLTCRNCLDATSYITSRYRLSETDKYVMIEYARIYTMTLLLFPITDEDVTPPYSGPFRTLLHLRSKGFQTELNVIITEILSNPISRSQKIHPSWLQTHSSWAHYATHDSRKRRQSSALDEIMETQR